MLGSLYVDCKDGLISYIYEQLCSKVVMGKDNSNAFHNVRMSLKKENVLSGRYKAYMYIEQVKKEYYEIINDIKTN